jgi:hypothetical protein
LFLGTGEIKMKKSKKTFEIGGIIYAVKKPTVQQTIDANNFRRETFNKELQSGALLRDQVDHEIRKRGLWNDEKEAEYQKLRKEIIDFEYRLAKGGIKLADAKKIALDMKKKRSEMVDLLSSRIDLDSNTCEGRADSARFNYLFANCLYYDETDQPYFPNGLKDYLVGQDDPVAVRGATEFYYLLSDTENQDDNLPENKFLKKFRFVDEKLRLVDKQGKLIDSEGRHINENGKYIKWISDTEHVFVDINGRELNEDGDFVVDAEPFLDDDGNPVLFDSEDSNVELSVNTVDSVGDVEEDKGGEPVKKKRTRVSKG